MLTSDGDIGYIHLPSSSESLNTAARFFRIDGEPLRLDAALPLRLRDVREPERERERERETENKIVKTKKIFFFNSQSQ